MYVCSKSNQSVSLGLVKLNRIRCLPSTVLSYSVQKNLSAPRFKVQLLSDFWELHRNLVSYLKKTGCGVWICSFCFIRAGFSLFHPLFVQKVRRRFIITVSVCCGNADSGSYFADCTVLLNDKILQIFLRSAEGGSLLLCDRREPE